MVRSLKARVLALVFLSLVAISAIAPAVAGASPWRGIGVTLYDLDATKTPTLVVFGSFAPGIEFPMTVELPIPSGSTVGWVGEVLGGDPALDPAVDYTVRAEEGYDVLVVSATQGGAIQAELEPPAGWVEFGDADISIAMSWIAHEDVPGVRMGFEVTQNLHAEGLQPASAAATLTPSGVLYSNETSPVAAGTTLSFAGTVVDGADAIVSAPASVTPPTATDPATEEPAAEEPAPETLPSSQQETSAEPIPQRTLLIALLSALVVVLLAALVYVLRSQRRG